MYLDLSYLRMDGRDKQDKRDKNVKKFQKDESVRCFMLTTGVGAGTCKTSFYHYLYPYLYRFIDLFFSGSHIDCCNPSDSI